MPEQGSEVRQIVWSDAFPIVRLFRTTRMALGPKRMLLGLACVLLVYFAGRLLDAVWPGVVVAVERGTISSEVQQFARLPQAEFVAWVREAREAPGVLATAALLRLGLFADPDEARAAYESQGFRALVLDGPTREQIRAQISALNSRVQDGVQVLRNNRELSRTERARRTRALHQAADTVKRALHMSTPPGAAAAGRLDEALERIAAAVPAESGVEPLADLRTVLKRTTAVAEYQQWRPRGPFISFLEHQQHCFAAAIQGAVNGRLGFSGGAYSTTPSMAASMGSAVQGVLWIGTQRPFYTLWLGLFALVVFALFGGAICRSAAVHAAREDSESVNASLKFVGERYSGFLIAPLVPIGVIAVSAVLMFMGGLLGAVIPWGLGEVFAGLLWILSLVGGLVAALALFLLVFGFPLMWPSIAVEGSDGNDALSHAASYVFGRFWNLLVYSVTLLVYGAFSYLAVRFVVLLTLKFSHKLSGLGMNQVPSGQLRGTMNLDALWTMPAWSDLALLPGTQAAEVWGTFPGGPLGALEGVGQFLMMCWVFVAVSLLGAFVVSYYFTGATLMYFQLRRDVDATDYEELYYEEMDDPYAPILGTTTEPDTASPPSGGSETASGSDSGSPHSGAAEKDSSTSGS